MRSRTSECAFGSQHAVKASLVPVVDYGAPDWRRGKWRQANSVWP